MGYYTTYDINIYDRHGHYVNDDVENQVMHSLNDIVGFTEDRETILASELCYDSMKWYDHGTDMIKLSLEYPELIFSLYGQGEDVDDRWYAFFHNGESEVCEAHISFDEPQTKFGQVISDEMDWNCEVEN